MYTAIFIGDFLNPVIITPLRRTWGLHAALLIVSLLLIVGCGYSIVRNLRVRRAVSDGA